MASGRSESVAVMPLIRELDSSAGPLNFFGAELRRARTAAGLSQEQLGQRVGYSGAQVGKVETGDRAPSLDFAQGCDEALPDAGGLFARIYELARRWDGGYPSWFAEWIEAERRATSLCWWEPLLVPGLLQTADYARAILAAGAGHDRRRARGACQRLGSSGRRSLTVPSRRSCGSSWTRRCCIGSSARARSCMTSCCTWPTRPAARASRSRSCPLGSARTPGLLGGFAIASVDGAPSTVYMESPDQGQTTEKPSVVGEALADLRHAEG